jgi:predicted Rossmann fold flavoprotein
MSTSHSPYDLIVVGAGPAGMIASIRASSLGKRVLLLEKLSKVGAKLNATGGGRCNLTNTYPHDHFIQRFGRHGRFMQTALHAFDAVELRSFFEEIGVPTHAPDGYRVFPTTHSATTIVNALYTKMQQLSITIQTKERVSSLLYDEERIQGVVSTSGTYYAPFVIIASGGMGYPMLGAQGDGYTLAKSIGHTITPLSPAMMPLRVKEPWVEGCRADTLPKVPMCVALKKYKKLHAQGDLIFTKNGIRGPVVLDFSREITPLLAKLEEVPLLFSPTQGMHEEQIMQHIKKLLQTNPHQSLLALLESLIPTSLAHALASLAHAPLTSSWSKIEGKSRDHLIKLLAWTPLTVVGHDGFKMAMITRGGVTLKEIDPNTMASRKMQGLYFCGEVVDLDGPCGGYNLQWSFSSGFLAGSLL